MQQSAHAIAQQSYSRCLRSPEFLPRFYEQLLTCDPSIPPMFAKTEFPKQYKLLQHGLGLLLSYANKPDDTLLARLAARHSSSGIDVSPPMYAYFVDSLVFTVRAYDPDWKDEMEAAWRDALRPGIEFMQARYAS